MSKPAFVFANAPVNALALALLLVAAVSFAADKSAKAPSKGPTGSRSTTRSSRRCSQESEAAGAYDVPDINLKKDENYANTSVDVEPFGGTKPFKENFLAS